MRALLRVLGSCCPAWMLGLRQSQAGSSQGKGFVRLFTYSYSSSRALLRNCLLEEALPDFSAMAPSLVGIALALRPLWGLVIIVQLPHPPSPPVTTSLESVRPGNGAGASSGATQAATQMRCSLLPARWLFLSLGSVRFAATSVSDSEASKAHILQGAKQGHFEKREPGR